MATAAEPETFDPRSGADDPTWKTPTRSPRADGVLLCAVWLLPLAAALVVALVARPEHVVDSEVFVPAGRTLLSLHWSSTFADPAVQAGPFEVLVFGGSDLLGRSTGLPAEILVSAVINVGVVALGVAVGGSMLKGRNFRRAGQLAAGLAIVALGLSHHALESGHPAEVVIPLMWVASVIALRRGHPLLAGSLLGLSAGWELWGVLGAPVALLADRPRDSAKVALAQIATIGIVFGPFVLSGPFRMFEYRWAVAVRSPLAFIVQVGTPVPWGYRLAQGAVALAFGSIVAIAARRSPHVIWGVPAGVIFGRFLLDPLNNWYYWLAIWIVAVIAVAEVATGFKAGLEGGRGSSLSS